MRGWGAPFRNPRKTVRIDDVQNDIADATCLRRITPQSGGRKRRLGQRLQIVFRDRRGRQIPERRTGIFIADQCPDVLGMERIACQRRQSIDDRAEDRDEGVEEIRIQGERLI